MNVLHTRSLKLKTARLRKLIVYLKTLNPSYFNFSELVIASREMEKHLDGHRCGSVGCAIGYASAVFPDLVRIGSDGTSLDFRTREGWRTDINYSEMGELLFNIPEHTGRFLFTPGNQGHVHYNLPSCDAECPPYEVAEMLEKFIELVERDTFMHIKI